LREEIIFATSVYLYLFGARDPYDTIRETISVFLSVVYIVFVPRRNHISTQIHRTSKLAAATVEPEIKVYVI
jgi:hypothetical protein